MIIVNCRLAREAGLEYVEIQNLTDFYDDNRYMSTPYYMFLFSTFPLFGLMFWKIIFSRQLFACANFQMLECGLFANFELGILLSSSSSFKICLSVCIKFSSKPFCEKIC